MASLLAVIGFHSTLGHSGQALAAVRSVGGQGIISSWVTLAQPGRMAVPDTVVAGIATADDQHLFVLGTHGRRRKKPESSRLRVTLVR